MSNSHEKAPLPRNQVARTKNAAQSAAAAKRGTPQPTRKKLSLAQWVHHTIAIPQARVQLRTRGNNLHILVEGEVCPESSVVLPRLVCALAKIRLERLLPKDQPQIYQIFLHGRTINSIRPDWTEVILLNQIDRYLEGLQTPTHEAKPARTRNAALVVSNQSLAQQGKPEAIARYLSETLSNLGIAVQVSAKTVFLEGEKELATSPSSPTNRQPSTVNRQRLSITCESAYSPDPSLIAEPITQRLRELQLQGFQDAIVVSQVQGEAKPDWLLRVDLTPREEMLRDWARWGDVQAITQLLNLTLADQQVEISTSLKDFTLHVTCTVTQPESDVAKQPVMTTLAPLLETLAPQGIHAATVYGFQRSPADAPHTEAPLWVDWLDLPASMHPALAPSTLAVAQQGDLDAITFLLSRLLNTNLDAYLATGGTRIQIRQKDDLLHIMADAPVCPEQRALGKPIARLLRPLKIPGVSGIRVYGRRSGQKRPLWSYGVDFETRDRLVPEATPEFAASDAYVGDLIAKPGALVVRSQIVPDSVQTRLLHALQQTAQQTQQFLLKTRLFTLQDATTPLSPPTSDPQPRHQAATLVAVWGALGLLLTLQTDWILGQMLRSSNSSTTAQTVPSPAKAPNPDVATSPQDLPNLALKKSPNAQDGFNAEGFTGSGSVSVIVEDGTGRSQSSPNASSLVTERGTQLNASPLQPLATALPKPGTPGAAPTFNSRQLDEKVKLYRDRIAISGRPDVLIIGSSRALRGIDPIALEKALATQGYPDVDIFNFGINGATVQVVDLVVREILAPEELPKLILWADGARAFNSGRLDVTYNGIVASAAYKQLSQNRPTNSNAVVAATNADPVTGEPTAPSTNSYQAMNQRLDQWLANFSATYHQREQLKTRLQEKVAGLLPRSKAALPPQSILTQPGASPSQTGTTSLPSEGQGLLDINGFLPLSNRFNPVTYYQKYARVPGDYDGDYESFTMQGKQIDALTSLVQFTQAQQISLVFINLPLTESYLDPVRQEYETEFQQVIRSQAAQQQFIYLDLSRNWLNENDFFSDPSHLNRYGAYAVSQELATSAMIPWAMVQK
jgi:acid stress-induced BolA-like protein IbaG/YrbA